MASSTYPDPTDSGWGADESLTCDVVPEREVVRVRVAGALDLATADSLELQLAELRSAGFAQLVLDMRDLRFIDSTGLRLVLRWHETAVAEGFELRFIPGPASVQRIFEITGTAAELPFSES